MFIAKKKVKRSKGMSTRKRIAVFFLTLLTVFSFFPLSKAKATESTNDSRVLTMDTGEKYNGFGIAGHEVQSHITNYIRRALSTQFYDKNSGRWMDLASAWNNLGHAWAIDGVSSDGIKSNGTCSYKWKDFSGKDMPADLYRKVLSSGVSGKEDGVWWGNRYNAYLNYSAQSEGYKYEQRYDKNHFAGSYIGYYRSGLQHATSLQDASNAIEDTIKTAVCPYGGYKTPTPAHYTWTKDAEKYQDVFYMDDGFAAQSWNFNGKCRQARYAHTGVFLYNFKVTPYYADAKDFNVTSLATDKDSKYIPEEYIRGTNDINNTPYEDKGSFERTITTTDSTTMTINHTDQHTETNGWGVKVGLSYKSIWKDIREVSASFEFNYNHSASDSFSDGWSNSKTASSSSTDKYTFGPYTKAPWTTAVVSGTCGHKSYTATFKTPLMLSFDVAIVNWVIDPSDDDAKDECALVVQLGTAHNFENATEEIRYKADDSKWLDDFYNKFYNRFGFAEGRAWARACADNIPISDQTVTLEHKIPWMVVENHLIDNETGKEIKKETVTVTKEE